jgi:hypothetical protein
MDRITLYGAIWLFCYRYHSGQSSRGYRILSRLMRAGYRPGFTIQSGRFESDDQHDAYMHLVARYSEAI